MGVFVVKPFPGSAESNALETRNLKVKRFVPEAFQEGNEQIVTLKAGESKIQEVTLKAPDVVGLERGNKYSVGISGRWHGVWIRGVGNGEALRTTEESSVLRGDIEVEGVEAECY
jgi:hypothetical protein